MPRGVRRGFVGIPGPRTRRRIEVPCEEEATGLAAQYAAAVRRHDAALAELRRLGAEMAEALSRQTERAAVAAMRAPYALAPEPAEAPGSAEAEADDASEKPGERRRRKPQEEPRDSDRPTNLRGERNPQTGSVCLSWDATPREGLLFGVWRSVTPREGPAGAFERIAMVREAGYIDGDAPVDARRISYAVRALDGRRPVPGSAHVTVTPEQSRREPA